MKEKHALETLDQNVLGTEESAVKRVVFFKYLGKSDRAQQVDRYRSLPSIEL